MGFDLTDFYDTELTRLDPYFRAVLQVAADDRVLDVGCGAGQSSRQAARLATRGSVLGIDVSGVLLQAARQRSAEQGIPNVKFVLADAQDHPFDTGYFDLCISRFGTLFFDNPPVAFANLVRAMAPGARLVMMVWQEHGRNEWATALQRALAPHLAAAARSLAFSLAKRQDTTRLLTDAGLRAVEFAEVEAPVCYGPTIEAAHSSIIGLFIDRGRSPGSPPPNAKTLQRLRALLEAHLTPTGVLFGSRAWIVSARK